MLPELRRMFPALHTIDRRGQAVGKLPLVAGGAPLHARHILQCAEAAGPAGAWALPARQAGVTRSACAAEAASAPSHWRTALGSALTDALRSQCAQCLRRIPREACRGGRRRARRCTHHAASSAGLVCKRAGLAAPQHSLLPEDQAQHKSISISPHASVHAKRRQSA